MIQLLYIFSTLETTMRTPICGVYAIECTETGTTYIGASRDVKRRMMEHKRLLNKGKHRNRLLQEAWNSCGSDCFIFRIVEILEYDLHLIQQAEQRWIDSISKEKRFNIMITTSIANPEARLKISSSNKWRNAKEDMERPETLNIRLSPEEKEIAQRLARREGLTLSAYIRRLILLTSHKEKQAA